MLADIVGFLQCPHCGSYLDLAANSLVCSCGHSFDVARQGYVNLLPGDAHTGTADTPEMVAARDAFLSSGHFEPVRSTVAELAGRASGGGMGLPEGCIVEVGAGTGYHLAGVLDLLPGRVGMALDLSKYAARRAARVHSRIGAVVCDTWGTLPVRAGVAALVLDVFAPRNAIEFARILAQGGNLIVVTPAPEHLHELMEPLGMVTIEGGKQERLARDLEPGFDFLDTIRCREFVTLGRDDILALVEMGPSARHIGKDELAARIDRLGPEVLVTVSVTASLYRRARP